MMSLTKNLHGGDTNHAPHCIADENDHNCCQEPQTPIPPINPRRAIGNNGDNVNICTIIDQVKTMIKQEEQYICPDYYDLKGTNTKKNNKGASIDMVLSCRTKVCQWIFQMVQRTHLQNPSETAIVAISYLDRFLSCSSTSPRAKKAKFDRREYQLVAITCLYIALKMSESIHGMDPATLSRLSRGGRHTEQDVIDCEHDIFASLRWKLNGPTPFQFIRCILDLLPDSARSKVMAPKIRDSSHRQVELAIGDYAFIQLRRSSIAVASVLNALEGEVSHEDFSVEERTQFVQLISDTFDVHNSALVNALRKRLLKLSAKCGVKSSPSHMQQKIQGCQRESCKR